MGKGRSPIDGDLAASIARKLGATVDKTGKHIRAVIRHNGALVANFGWRHDRKAGNGNIPKDLGLSPHITLDMARCNPKYDRDYYIEFLRSQNKVPFH